ncbi:MAG: ABC transporter ATP-binding protein [Actinomycetota bacterium]
MKDLRKNYGSVEAVRGVDLRVAEGECFALLGPNGAGKTTTVEILEGHRSRSGGDVGVLGHDPAKKERALKERIGIVLQETGVERYLTVAEVIEQFRGYYPHPRPLDEVIEVVGLQDKRNERVRKLSGGQQRRLDVAVGLAGDPELLFLDEPTTGFDPGARRGAWQMIENLKALGKTVFLTTHYMDEAQRLADRVAIIADGKIVAEGTPASLAGNDPTARTVSFTLEGGIELPSRWRERATAYTGVVSIRTSEAVKDLHELTRWALDNDVDLAGLEVRGASLEDVYLALTGGNEEAPE